MPASSKMPLYAMQSAIVHFWILNNSKRPIALLFEQNMVCKHKPHVLSTNTRNVAFDREVRRP
jgi:hypothetical protein